MSRIVGFTLSADAVLAAAELDRRPVVNPTLGYYQQAIYASPAARGLDPRHVEAYIRLEHATLDSLTAAQFAQEIVIGAECVRSSGTENAEALAKSMGL